MAQRLAQMMHKLVGESQIGFQILRDIGENIDLMEETLRYANEEAYRRGGAIAIFDNDRTTNGKRASMNRTLNA